MSGRERVRWAPIVAASSVFAVCVATSALFAQRTSPTSAAHDARPERAAPAASGSDAACPVCRVRDAGVSIARNDAIEVSGIVASTRHDGVFYVHNDSGDVARFFALGSDGRDLGAFVVEGAHAIDWEDAALGPCDTGTCLYFADVGDNLATRSTYSIVRVAEPARLGAGVHRVRGDVLSFRYPDGSHDAETLLVDPASGAVFVVTKGGSASRIYEVPRRRRPHEVVVAIERGGVTALGSPFFTGGSAHPREGVLLRAYGALYLYPRVATGRIDEALRGPPCRLPSPPELQGEAVTWLPSGRGYATMAEGRRPRLHVADCAP